MVRVFACSFDCVLGRFFVRPFARRVFLMCSLIRLFAVRSFVRYVRLLVCLRVHVCACVCLCVCVCLSVFLAGRRSSISCLCGCLLVCLFVLRVLLAWLLVSEIDCAFVRWCVCVIVRFCVFDFVCLRANAFARVCARAFVFACLLVCLFVWVCARLLVQSVACLWGDCLLAGWLFDSFVC